MLKKTYHRNCLNAGPPIRYHLLKGKIISCFGLSWTEYLILNALIEIEESKIFPCAKDIIAKLQMNPVWVYRHIKLLSERGLISTSVRKPGIPQNLSIGFIGKRLLLKIQSEYFDID